MAGNITAAIIKSEIKFPDRLDIQSIITCLGFKIKKIAHVRLTKDRAEDFYSVHRGKPFFDKLVNYMTSADITIMILEKENAVEDFRKLIGATDPKVAWKGTIRNMYGKSIEMNAIHGSDSDENALAECGFLEEIIDEHVRKLQ